MHRLVRSLVVPAALAALALTALAAEAIDWSSNLTTATAQAKERKVPILVCINAKFVDGRTDEEPGAKALRESVYLDPQVVKRSKDFVCVFLTPENSVGDYDKLRKLGIDGNITSPQHIFIAPEGDRIVLRKPYWSYGKGERAVKALLELMDKGEAAAAGKVEEKDALPEDPAPPPGDHRRAEWIARQIEMVKSGTGDRDAVLARLLAADAEGDCAGPVVALLPEYKKDVPMLVALIRALGRDGLAGAADPLTDFLKHKDASVRGNAAVSLEYIGHDDKDVINALSKYAAKEKDETLANHGFRALGRCGRANPKVGALLLKQAQSARSDFASYGPLVGLAYFEGQTPIARGLEDLLSKMGVPGGKRGGGRGTVKRGVMSWTLANIGDVKSGEFVETELLDKLENVQAFWVDGLKAFWRNTADACYGKEGALEAVESGVGGFVRFGAEWRNRGKPDGAEEEEPVTMMDDCRKDREAAGFKPKGDWLLDDQR